MTTTTSYGGEQAAITARIEREWGGRTPIAFGNQEIDPAGQAHLEVRIVNQAAFNASVAATSQRVRHPGMVVGNIRVPLGTGDGHARDLGDHFAAIFRNLTADGITFRAPTLRDLGRSGAWHLVQVDCPFYRDSIHND